MSTTFSNTVGGTYDRTKMGPKYELCPFCATKLIAGSLQWPCGFSGNAAPFTKTGKVLSICKNAGPVVTKPPTPNALKPGDIVKMKFDGWSGTPCCSLCGEQKHNSSRDWLCGGSNTLAGAPQGMVKVITPCSRYVPAAPAMGFIASAIDQKALAASLITKPTEACSNKPRINCPKCGAYGADKHRIGCTTGGI